MPMVNRRLPSSVFSISRNNCASFPTAPSVMNTTWRRRLASRPPDSARRSAGSITVPPPARMDRTRLFARPIFATSAGRKPPNRLSWVLAKRMMSKRSFGRNRSSAVTSARLACLIDAPAMDPERSMTNTASRGGGGVATRSSSGGSTMTRR